MAMTTVPSAAARAPLRQRGAALLMAMLVVALVATLASAMVWQQWRAVQVEAAERSRLQSSWLLSGALDFTRLVLGTDARTGGADTLLEPWAIPLKEARLSDFLAADKSNLQDAPDAFLSGTIVDAQSRFNLRNLLEGDGTSPSALAAFRKLCGFAGVGAGVADRIAGRLRDAALPPERQPADAPLMPQSVEQLGWLGIDAETRRRLAPLVVLLPNPTPVNANTAPREVLAAVVEGLDLGGADGLIQRRPFQTAELLKRQLGEATPADPKQIGVSTSHFEVTGRLRLDNHVLQERSLLLRGRRGVVPLARERSNLQEAPP